MVCAQFHLEGNGSKDANIIHAVQRNFGGYFGNFKPAEVFLKTIFPHLNKDLLLPAKDLIVEAIKQEGETRYILLLTQNNAALNIIQDQVHCMFYFVRNGRLQKNFFCLKCSGDLKTIWKL